MTIRFGIIGLGNRGYKYALRTIQHHKDVEITMVCDAFGNNFHHFPEIANTTDYLELLAKPISTNTPKSRRTATTVP